MIKAVFFDIDGTLLDKKGSLLPSTWRAVHLLKAQGIVCGIATGRSPIKLQQLINYLPADCYVVYNGQLVFTEDRGIYDYPFPRETVERLAVYGDETNSRMIFGTRHAYHGSQTMQVSQTALVKKIKQILPLLTHYRKLGQTLEQLAAKPLFGSMSYQELEIFQENIYQCVLISPLSAQKQLEQTFPDCHFARSNPYSVDIIPKGGSKLVGIQQVIDYLGVDMGEVAVFGDSWNDIEMLTHAGLGVAMGNSNADVKRVADFVTWTNDEDGIFHALKHFNII